MRNLYKAMSKAEILSLVEFCFAVNISFCSLVLLLFYSNMNTDMFSTTPTGPAKDNLTGGVGPSAKPKAARKLIFDLDDEDDNMYPLVIASAATANLSIVPTTSLLAIPQIIDFTSDNYLDRITLELKRPINLFNGLMHYLRAHFSFSSGMISTFRRVNSKYNKDGLCLVLTSHEVSRVIYDTFKRFMQTLVNNGLCEDLCSGVQISYGGETNFFKFADDFKVYDSQKVDITSTFDWTGSYTCSFLFTIFGLFEYIFNGETHYKIQVKVRQMKVYETASLNNNSLCLL